MCDLSDSCRFVIDKAIEGYRFQVERYNTWMNYYSIFVGALFVAFYTVMTIGDDNNVLAFVIASVGWFSSLCWYASLLGYWRWNSHWMSVVHRLEKAFMNVSVYGDLPVPDTNRSYKPGFISTQKVTLWFIGMVGLAWIVMAACVFPELIRCFCKCPCGCNWCDGAIFALIAAVVDAFILAFLHGCGCRLYSSKLK